MCAGRSSRNPRIVPRRDQGRRFRCSANLGKMVAELKDKFASNDDVNVCFCLPRLSLQGRLPPLTLPHLENRHS